MPSRIATIGQCEQIVHPLRFTSPAPRSAKDFARLRRKQAISRVHLWSASMLQEVIAFVYSANGVLVSLVYLPQLHTVWNDRTGAQAGSLLTWSLFSLSSMVALLYGVLVLHDGRMVLAAGSSTAGSLSVLGTAVYRRQQAKRQQ
jgi:uncharacterized protein with PQ loop repeat